MSFGSRLELTPQKYVTFTKDWLSKGAKIIGGCCEIRATAHCRNQQDQRGKKLMLEKLNSLSSLDFIQSI